MRDVVRVPVDREAPSRWTPVQIALVAVAATCAVFVPQLVTDTGQVERLSPWVNLAWLVLLLGVPPSVAGVLAGRGSGRVDGRHALLVGLPQLLVVPVLVRLDVWLEVRSGYLLPGSGEEAMAYGIGTTVGLVGGLLLGLLVSLATHSAGRPGASAPRGADARPGG